MQDRDRDYSERKYPPAPAGIDPEAWEKAMPGLWIRLTRFWQSVERDAAQREAQARRCNRNEKEEDINNA